MTTRACRQIDVERVRDVFCVHMRQRKLDETEVQEFTEDVVSLIRDDGCRKLALSLGPGSPECLYSIFLAKLFTIRRRMMEAGGRLKLCDATPDVIGVFEAVHLKHFFEFAADLETAIKELSAP